MALIIRSFESSKGKRYYRFWNTFRELPETIPMNFLTFLQYKGLHNKNFVKRLHHQLPDIIQIGNTLLNNLDQQYRDFADINAVDKYHSTECDRISSILKSIFLEIRDFDKFYPAYKNVILPINPHPYFPRHFYLSWSYLIEQLYAVEELAYPIFSNYFPEMKNPSEMVDDVLFGQVRNTFDFTDWYLSYTLAHDREKLLVLLLALAETNYIKIDSIPHIFRDDPRVILLFEAYGMENLLPSRYKHLYFYQLNCIPTIKVIHEYGEKFLRQFLHYKFQHDYSTKEHRLFQYDKEYLLKNFREYLENFFGFSGLINLSDEFGNILYPFQYLQAEQFDVQCPYLFFNFLSDQSYHIFSKNGFLIDADNYNFIYIKEPHSYDGCISNFPDEYHAFRCQYDFLEGRLEKNELFFNEPPEEYSWK